MEGLTIFKLLNLLIKLNDDERAIIASHEMFSNIRGLISKDADYIKVEDHKTCCKQLSSLISMVAQSTLDHLQGFQHTNRGMSNYLNNLLEKNTLQDPIKVSATLCALGNAHATYDVREGLDRLKSHIQELEQQYLAGVGHGKDYDALNELADRLVYCQQIAQIVCTFMIAKYGSETGVGEHFGQNVKETPTELSEKDTDHSEVFEGEIAGNEDHSLFQHYSTLLQGLEEFHAADGYVPVEQQSFNQRYAMGVMVSNGIIPTHLQGMEGAMWDKVKAGFQKAFKIVRDGLTAMKENYFDKSLEQIADDLKKASDENKKALNAVTQKDAVLTETAKKGIERLAEQTENDEIKTIVGGLSNVASAPGVIDKLMTVFTKAYGAAGDMQKKFNEVDKNLKDLESQANGSGPDDADKEALAVKKQALTEKSKETRGLFDELKKQLADQRKQVTAISKAIRGIVPGIFYAEKTEGEKNE